LTPTGKRRGRKPSPEPTKVRATITIDPQLKEDIDAYSGNLSGFLEAAGRKELNRLKKRVGPNEGPKA
jgi:post-segregation antitoxin (ccd killing protein)